MSSIQLPMRVYSVYTGEMELTGLKYPNCSDLNDWDTDQSTIIKR